MKQQVLKALANPAYIFHVPYSLAIINFLVQFIVFIVVFVTMLVFKGIDVNPLWFLLSVLVVHGFLIIFSKKEPQIDNIIKAKIQLIKKRIPKRLAA